MPIYEKTINGNVYLYDQRSVYRPGRSPRSVMKYLGPKNPKRKRKQASEKRSVARELIMMLGGPEHPIDWAATLRSEPGEHQVEQYPTMKEELDSLLGPEKPEVNAVSKTADPPANLPTGQEKAPEEGASSAPQSDDVGGVSDPSADGGNEPTVD